MKKSKIIFSIIGMLSLSFIACGISNLYQPKINNEVGDSIDEIIKEEGISIKSLKTINNDDGTVSKVFTYSVHPDNATNQNVTVSAKYIDDTNCDDVVTTSVDCSKKEITITCLKDFSKQIIVNVVSSMDSTKKATVTVDYIKKVKSINGKDEEGTYYIGPSQGNWSTKINDFATESIVDVNYSQYTKDKNYTFSMKVISIDIDEICLECYPGAPEYQVVSDVIETDLSSYVSDSLELGRGYLSGDELWNVSDTNEWHSVLKKSSVIDCNTAYFGYSISAMIKCNEDATIQKAYDFYVYCGVGFDYSSKTVGVSSIGLELTNIEF